MEAVIIRFLVGIFGILGVLAFSVALEGSSLLLYLALTPGLIALFVPAFAVLAAFPPSAWGGAWKDALGRKGPGSSAARSADIWDFQEKASYAGGVIGLLVGLVIVLTRLADPTRIGSAVAVCLVCPLYSLILGLLCRILKARTLRGGA